MRWFTPGTQYVSIRGFLFLRILAPIALNLDNEVQEVTINSLDLLGKRASVRGWYGGTAVDSEDTLLFSQLNDIASMNEVFPLEEAQAAYGRMMSLYIPDNTPKMG